MEMHVHSELSRDGFGLVHAPGSSPIHIELLKGDDVGLTRRQHLGDPRW
jgi:hypothetical protein